MAKQNSAGTSKTSDEEHVRWATNPSLLHVAGARIDDARLSAILDESPDIEYLLVQDANVTDLGLSKLTTYSCLHGLTHLGLIRTPISDVGIGHVAKMSRLTSLNLAHCHVTDAGLQFLAQLDRLAVLYLQNTLVTDRGMPYLTPITSLEMIHLDRTALTDAGMAYLPDKSLTMLGVSYTAVTDSGLAFIPIQKIEIVYLSGTALTDRGLETLQGCPKLRMLYASNTAITGEGVLRLISSLKTLEYLDISSTAAAREALDAIKTLAPSLQLHV